MIDFIFDVLGQLLYPLFSVIFVFLRGIQNLFYAFAGVGFLMFDGALITGQANTGAETDSGLIYFLFQTSAVKNMLMSIMFLALFLVIIFTVMAFLKNMYAAKQKGWKEIIGNALKGMANFVFIPVCCLLGAWLGNILLQAINGATSSGGTTSMDRKLFVCAATNANKFRTGDMGTDDETIKALQEWANGLQYLNSNEKYKGSSIQLGKDAEYYALIVDDIYANTTVSINSLGSVKEYYNSWEINYLVLIVAGVFMLYALCALAFAMVRRMFILVILFIISPGVCAMYPLDEGKAVGQWKDKFIKEFLSVYGSVAGINIFFALMPLVDKIGLAGLGADVFMDSVIQIFILTSGLFCVKEVTGLVSGLIGANDAYGNASSQMKQTAGKVAKVGLGALAVSRFVGKGVATTGKAAYGAAKETGRMIGRGARAAGAGIKSVGGDVSKKFNDVRDSRAQMKGFQSYADMKAKNKQDKQDEKIQKKAERKGLTINDYKAEQAGKALNKEMKKQKRQASFNDFKQKTSDGVHALGAGASKLAHNASEGIKKSWVGKSARAVSGSMHRAGDAARAKAEAVHLGDATKSAGEGFKGLGEEFKALGAGFMEESGLSKITKKITDTWTGAGDRDKTRRSKSQSKKDAQTNAENAIATAEKNFQDKYQAAEDAKGKLKTIRKPDGTEELDTKKVSAAELEVLRIQAQTTNNKGKFTSGALNAQEKLKEALEKNENIENYKKKQADAEAAAEALKSKLDAAAEVFKGGMKDAAQTLSTALKKALDEDAIGPDLTKILQDAFKKINPRAASSLSESDSKKTAKLLEEILKELQTKK